MMLRSISQNGNKLRHGLLYWRRYKSPAVPLIDTDIFRCHAPFSTTVLGWAPVRDRYIFWTSQIGMRNGIPPGDFQQFLRDAIAGSSDDISFAVDLVSQCLQTEEGVQSANKAGAFSMLCSHIVTMGNSHLALQLVDAMIQFPQSTRQLTDFPRVVGPILKLLCETRKQETASRLAATCGYNGIDNVFSKFLCVCAQSVSITEAEKFLDERLLAGNLTVDECYSILKQCMDTDLGRTPKMIMEYVKSTLTDEDRHLHQNALFDWQIQAFATTGRMEEATRAFLEGIKQGFTCSGSTAVKLIDSVLSETDRVVDSISNSNPSTDVLESAVETTIELIETLCECDHVITPRYIPSRYFSRILSLLRKTKTVNGLHIVERLLKQAVKDSRSRSHLALLLRCYGYRQDAEKLIAACENLSMQTNPSTDLTGVLYGMMILNGYPEEAASFLLRTIGSKRRDWHTALADIFAKEVHLDLDRINLNSAQHKDKESLQRKLVYHCDMWCKFTKKVLDSTKPEKSYAVQDPWHSLLTLTDRSRWYDVNFANRGSCPAEDFVNKIAMQMVKLSQKFAVPSLSLRFLQKVRHKHWQPQPALIKELLAWNLGKGTTGGNSLAYDDVANEAMTVEEVQQLFSPSDLSTSSLVDNLMQILDTKSTLIAESEALIAKFDEEDYKRKAKALIGSGIYSSYLYECSYINECVSHAYAVSVHGVSRRTKTAYLDRLFREWGSDYSKGKPIPCQGRDIHLITGNTKRGNSAKMLSEILQGFEPKLELSSWTFRTGILSWQKVKEWIHVNYPKPAEVE